MLRNKKPLFLFLLFVCLIIFFIAPLLISISYGNKPIYNRNYLFSQNIIISDDPELNESWISSLNYNIYTWREIETYIINKQMTFYHIFRDIIVVTATAILAVLLDRLFGRRFPRITKK